MGHDDHGSFPLLQGLLQLLDETEGQVVRGLVKQQQVGGAGEQAREGEAAALARGEAADRDGEVGPASIRSRVDLPAPFSPTIPIRSPGRTVSETWSSSSRSPRVTVTS